MTVDRNPAQIPRAMKNAILSWTEFRQTVHILFGADSTMRQIATNLEIDLRTAQRLMNGGDVASNDVLAFMLPLIAKRLQYVNEDHARTLRETMRAISDGLADGSQQRARNSQYI